MTWKKGQSGNLRGRVSDSDKVKRLARKHTVTAIGRLSYWAKQDADAAASVKASMALLDRGWGKPTEYKETTIIRRKEEMTDDELLAIAVGGRMGSVSETASAAEPTSIH